MFTFVVVRVLAFDSYPTPNSVHDQITQKAAEMAGISSDVGDLEEAVRQPDWDETSLPSLDPNDDYVARHHFDRPPGISDPDAFLQAAEYTRNQRDEAIQHANAEDYEDATSALGRALHAIQDLCSHSNLVDLPESERNAILSSVLSSAQTELGNLRITGFDPDADEPGLPANDPYAHDSFSKDNAEKNDECQLMIDNKTKFELAKELAVEHSAKLLTAVKESLVVAKWDELVEEFD